MEQREQENFESLVKQYRRVMVRSIRRTGVSSSEVDIVLSETLESLNRLKDTIEYADEERLKNLCWTAARNAAIDFLRRQEVYIDHRAVAKVDPDWRPRNPDPSLVLGVHEALGKLSETDRFIAWRYWGLKYSLREIQEDLQKRGISWVPSTILRKLKDIKPRLRKALS